MHFEEPVAVSRGRHADGPRNGWRRDQRAKHVVAHGKRSRCVRPVRTPPLRERFARRQPADDALELRVFVRERICESFGGPLGTIADDHRLVFALVRDADGLLRAPDSHEGPLVGALR